MSIEEADEMDERGQELGELRDYGNKMLEEMRHSELIDMLQKTITHLHDIAGEYSKEADEWHVRYDACEKRYQELQIEQKKQKEDWNQKEAGWKFIIGAQSEKIQKMDDDFQNKLHELRTYRDEEIARYNEKVQSLLTAQDSLARMRNELAEEKQKLEDARKQYEDKKAECEGKEQEYEQHRKQNQTKLDAYDELYEYKLDADSKIKEARKNAEAKVEEATKENAEWNRKFDEEHARCEKLEKELEELKKKLQGNEDSNNEEQCIPADFESMRVESSGINAVPARGDDDDDDGMR